jgi:lipoprotein-anchoring transpeptidase ErfK/SrfK
MSRVAVSSAFVGNEFVIRAPRRVKISPVTATAAPQTTGEIVMPLTVRPREYVLPPMEESGFASLLGSLRDFFYRYSLALFVLLFLGVAGTGVGVGMSYWSAHVATLAEASASEATAKQALSLLNTSVRPSQLAADLQKLTNQAASLSIGGQTVPIGATTIRSWLQVTTNESRSIDNIHVNAAAIGTTLIQLANSYAMPAVNQVSVTHSDGTTPSGIILAGQNGTQVVNPGSLSSQASSLAKNVLGGGGLQFSAALAAVPYHAVTPAAFSKLIEVDVTTKRMYAYQNGQIVNTFLVTAGKPSTPTPLGEFHIWEKEALQTMTGPGYVQPNVPWINYFDHSGDAIHGNYWHVASVFGSVNTSHGCVGVQVPQAEWIYNWAPLGTTVIIYS